MAGRSCKYNKNQFCYICGRYLSIISRSYSITSNELATAYDLYFGMKITQDIGKAWAPEYSCSNCYTTLLSWMKGTRSRIRNPCVFCLFHAQSHEKYTRIEWEPRNSFITGQNSVENPPIIANDRIIFPVLHLNLVSLNSSSNI